ncbi:MAG: hemolysin family protein [Spirochaetaceae bacterium]|jgi:putative hemolysin|nr:hemolysin family protein [Spirochaetaceae bacterium]
MLEDPLLWQLVLQAFLIGINAFFACAEIALLSLNDAKLEKRASEGDKGARQLLALTKTPAKFLATIQVLITLSGFLGSAFAAENFSQRLTAVLGGLPIPESTLKTVCLVVITVLLSYITLVLGELVPKRIAMRKADELSVTMGPVIYVASIICSPLVSLLTASTNAVLRLLGVNPEAAEETLTEADIRLLIDSGGAKGAIRQTEHEFINNIFAFDDKNAADVMTHRTDVVFLWLEDDDAAWEKTVKSSRHTFFPVCGDSEDEVTRLLSARDYFRLDDKSRANVLENACFPPFFIPESVKTDVLFRNMKKNRTHFAIVLDEYGSMSGIVTMNDLLEELVGNFLHNHDSGEAERPLIEKKAHNLYCIRGGAPIDKVAEALHIAKPDGNYDTFGGFVFSVLGRVPEDGEEVFVETGSLEIHVLSVKDHRLEEAQVRKKER